MLVYQRVVYGVNAPRRAWFFPRLCSLAVYVFNALADCKMTLPKTRCPTLLLTSCYLDREGGDDNVPFDCKNTMLYSDGALAWPKVSKEMRKGFRIKQVSHRRQEFLRGRNIGTQIADSRWKSMQSWIPKTVKTLYRGRLNKKLMIYVRSWQFRFAHQHQYIQTLGKLFKTKNAD